MKSSSADRNLLYGILALQMGFITRDALIAALSDWVLTRSRPLGEILIEQGGLAPQDHPAIEAVVLRLLHKHGDPGASLTALDLHLSGPACDLFPSLADSEIRESLALLDTRADARPAPDMGATVAWSESDPNGVLTPPDGTRDRTVPIGQRFRILRPHARGGLGEVYLARDQELGRNVALKEIRDEYAHIEKLRERFLREAEINGNLEHPAIVPVYGLGTYPDGRPYYAMRFVEGETLQAALDGFHRGSSGLDAAEWTIGLRQLLRRFLAICDAIDYAHNRGVLHRDLKPANILLGKFGETLIIDWGLAKLIGRAEPAASSGDAGEPAGPHDPEAGRQSTMAGETMGSPPYMSPEQARRDNDRLLPASDIYSLGATLYAVLTGKPPVVGLKVIETLEMVSQGKISPPAAVNPRVPKALEAICQKAMRLEPAGRYPTARALADDLESWLDDRPVAIYRDPPSTRLLRWSRHHRPFVASSLVLLLATAIGLGIIAVVVDYQKNQAEQSRIKAVLARQQTQKALEEVDEARRQAKAHLREVLEVVGQLVRSGDRQLMTQMPASVRNEFLDAASGVIRQSRERVPGDLSIQVEAAQIARRLANLHRLTGKFDRAEQFYIEAVATLTNLTKRVPNLEYQDLLAETLIDQGDSWLVRGKSEEAEKRFREARKIAGANVEKSPKVAALRRTLARSECRIAAAHLAKEQPDVADHARKALAEIQPLADAALPRVREAVVRGEILPLTDQLELVQADYTLSQGLEQAGKGPEAKDGLIQALDRMEILLKRCQGLPVPELDFFHAWVGTRLAKLVAKDPGGDAKKAAELLDDAVARLRTLVNQKGEYPHFRAALAESLVALAAIHEKAGPVAKAREDAASAHETIEPLLTDFPDVPEYASLAAEIRVIQGRMALRSEPAKRAEAVALFEDAVKRLGSAAAASPENRDYQKRLVEYRALARTAAEAR